jgi:hypothetical protein
MIEEVIDGGADGADLDEAIERMDGLHRLFWEEHEAFILIPSIHHLKGRHDVQASPRNPRFQS